MVRKRRFRRFRRRTSRGTWFPTLGTKFVVDDTSYNDASFSDVSESVSTSRADGVFGNPQIVIPVTHDFTQIQGISAGTTTEVSLRDVVEGQTWRLDRIVGHITVATFGIGNTLQPDTDEYWANLQIGAGFFLGRAIENDQAFPDLSSSEMDPLAAQNIQNPWIWRRTWILCNPYSRNPADFDPGGIPQSNQGIQGPTTGPSIDSKVKRKIPREYRLWFVIGALGWNGNQISVNPANLDQPGFKFNLDIRIFGKMQRGRNVGQF